MNKEDTETHKYWLNVILTECKDDLSDWEENFIGDVKVRLDNGWGITDRQEAKLEQIYTSKTS